MCHYPGTFTGSAISWLTLSNSVALLIHPRSIEQNPTFGGCNNMGIMLFALRGCLASSTSTFLQWLSPLGYTINLPFAADKGNIPSLDHPVGYTAFTRSTGTGSLEHGTDVCSANDTRLACLLRR